MIRQSKKRSKNKEGLGLLPGIFLWPALAIILAGCVARFYGVIHSGSFFFDTGMYLNYGRILLHPVVKGTPDMINSLGQLIGQWIELAVQTDRPLWQLFVDARILWGGTEDWWYIRILSGIMGTATLAVTYCFAQRMFTSKVIPLLSVVFLAFLPSHVFYSRVGLPEAATTLLFISGLYFYLFSKHAYGRTILSGALFLGAFLTNYRLLILPILVLCVECFMSFADKRKPDIVKWAWNAGVFLAGIICLCLFSTRYFMVTFHWVLHQADLAKQHFAWFNLATYPYILFRLDGWPLGLLFFGNIYFILKKQWPRLLPFFLVCMQMAIFSFSADKAARYVCMVTPFIAISAAVLAVALIEEYKEGIVRTLVTGLCLLTLAVSAIKIVPFLQAHSAYRGAMAYLNEVDPQAGVVTTQPLLLNLYVKNRERVKECPGIRDVSFLDLPASGYNYLMLGPQAYVSWTLDGVSFSGDLGGIPGFFKNKITPIKSFSHMNSGMLERFVFEHNQNLASSISFLSAADEHTGDLNLYDIPHGLQIMKQLLRH